MDRKLTIICDSESWDSINETHFFVDVLMGKLNVPVCYDIFNFEYDVVDVPNDVLIVNLENRLSTLVWLMVKKGVKNIGVVSWCHNYKEDRSYFPFVDYVMRPFYNVECLSPLIGSRCMDISWFPLGYKSGVGPRSFDLLLPFPERRFEMFFAGYLGTNQDERIDMLAVLDRFALPAKLLLTDGFGKGIGIHYYRSLLENSRLALCPGGKDPESIRLFEALELGAIPISLKHDFLCGQEAMANSPIVQLNSWDELPQWYFARISSKTYLEDMETLRLDVAHWWAAFKAKQQNKISSLINAAFGRYCS